MYELKGQCLYNTAVGAGPRRPLKEEAPQLG